MFTRTEQRRMHTAATSLRRVAGYIDAVSNIPSGVEASVLEILDDVQAELLQQAEVVRLIQESAKSRKP